MALQQLQTISASKLRVFRTCQRQFYYKYVLPKEDRLPAEKRVSGLLGTVLHKVIEMYYTGENTNSRALFQQLMLETVEQWEADGEKINGLEWFNKSLKDGKAMLNDFDWSKFNPIMHQGKLALEVAFELPFPNQHMPIVMIQGYIDMISDMGGINVIDHKSTQKVPNADQLAHDPQFLIYAWAFQQMYDVLPDKVIFNALRKGTQIEVDVLHEFDTKIAQMTTDILALIEPRRYYPRRVMDTECTSYCDFYALCYGQKMKEVANVISLD